MRNLLLSGVRLPSPVWAPPDLPAGGEGGGDPPAGGEGGNPPAGGEGGGGGDPPVAGSEGGDPPTGGEGGDPPVAAPDPDWRDRELGRKHAQLQDTRRQLAERDTELEALRAIASRVQPVAPAAGDPAAPPAAASAPVASQEEVERAAQRVVAQRDFDSAANDADRKGRDKYKGEWDTVTERLRVLGGFDESTMQYILAADEPSQVLFKLGSEPAEYQRIMDLPPAKRLAEIVKFGLTASPPAVSGKDGVPPPKRPSGAPPPTDPLTGRNRGDPNALTDDLTDDQWYARRLAQKKARYEAKTRGL